MSALQRYVARRRFDLDHGYCTDIQRRAYQAGKRHADWIRRQDWLPWLIVIAVFALALGALLLPEPQIGGY